MYNSGIEGPQMDRESMRQMALSQCFGPTYYGQSSKERITFRSMQQRSHSPRRYPTAQTGPISGCPPRASFPSPQPIPVDGSVYSYSMHTENSLAPSNSCWYEPSVTWPYSDIPTWRNMTQGCPGNINQVPFSWHCRITDGKRKRTSYTRNQLNEMENEFQKNRYITRERRIEMSFKLDLSERQLKTWFQNRRMKLKRDKMMPESQDRKNIEDSDGEEDVMHTSELESAVTEEKRK